MSKDKTWKESLLKSSLPLETIVAEILTQLDLEIEGEFSYLRTNQEGIETEFSIDIVAQKLFDLTNRTKNLGVIDFLVECKYCSPGIKWIFSPLPKYMGYRGFISVIDYLSIIKVKEILLSDPVEKYQYCLKGISLQDKTINPQVIKHGIDQLRYAIPPYQIDIYRIQLIPELSEIHYIIPILVTTAPIYVLHNNLSFSDILKADNLEQVAEKKDAVIIYNEAGAQL